MTKPKEEWRPVVGYEGWYKVSNRGRVKRVKTQSGKQKTGGGLRPGLVQGYPAVCLSLECVQTSRYVHRLVATAFLDNPDDKPEVNHRNGIKTDNRVENLEWVTGAENRQHAIDTGLQLIGGENHPASKATEADVRRIRFLAATGVRQRILAEWYGLAPATISTIVRRVTFAEVE